MVNGYKQPWRPEPGRQPERAPDDGEYARAPRPRPNLSEDHPELVARGLGWLSIALGVAEVAAPQRVAEWIGAPDRDSTYEALRVAGLRELVLGLGVLTHADREHWLKSRIAGDAMDLSLLGAAFNAPDARKERLAMAAATLAGKAMIDMLTARQYSRDFGEEVDVRPLPMGRRLQEGGIHVSESVTIQRPPAQIYQFWRDFGNLPRVMSHLERVQVLDNRRSHWVAKAPAGMTVEWDAEIIADRPNELITWRSLEGSGIENAGAVHFNALPGGLGTDLRIELRYNPPGGMVGAAVAKLFGEEPGQQVQHDLQRFKSMVEQLGLELQPERAIR